jgi:hypothetical protein
VFCLDPLTGNVLWYNPLKGFGLGLATIATEPNLGNPAVAAPAEKHIRDAEPASSAAVF